jgi:hypothetical protein
MFRLSNPEQRVQGFIPNVEGSPMERIERIYLLYSIGKLNQTTGQHPINEN